MNLKRILSIVILGFIAFFFLFKFVVSHSTSETLHVEGNTRRARSIDPNRQHSLYAYQDTKDYRVIAENNLFRPLGWKKEVVRKVVLPAPKPKIEPNPVVETPPPPPTYTLVLTGLVQSSAEWVAIFEDKKRDEGVFLRQGENLKDTLVNEIVPERITLARGDVKIQLALGESIEYGTDGQLLFGTVTTVKKSGSSSGASSSMSPEAQTTRTANPSPEAQTTRTANPQGLIERMRARRKKELER
jgi:hypothetical protein